MRLFISTFLVIFFLSLSLDSQASPTNVIYIQKDGRLLILSNIPTTGYENNQILIYQAMLNKQKFVITAMSSSELQNLLSFLFDKNLKINLYFENVKPNELIFFNDNELLDKTDKNGNAKFTQFYPEPGPAKIQLEDDKGDILDQSNITINNVGSINCFGNKKMQCLFTKEENT